MQLPYGTLAASRRGPADLKETGEIIAKDSLTGYLRVSVFGSSAVHECVIVYLAGRPVMAFASDGTADRKDPDLRHMSEAIRKDNAIVEICQLQDKQVKLLQDLYCEFAIATPADGPPAPQARPAPNKPPRAAPVARAASVPEVRGRFVRAENAGDLDEYLRRHPGDTGHLIFIAQANGRLEEHHVILIKGRIETAYTDRTSGPEVLEKLKGVPGHAEFYAVDEAVLKSIVGRHARPADMPAAERQAPGIGIPARDLLKASHAIEPSARNDINRTVDGISGSVEDEIAMMRRVEREFASHVDELLVRLELSHLRSRKKL